MSASEEILNRVRARAGEGGGHRATEAEIRAAEDRLGVTLPQSYRRFALEVGAVSWPVEIDAPATLRAGEECFGQPHYLVPFAHDGFGNSWCFDVRQSSGDEYPIVFWDHEETDEEMARPRDPGPVGAGFNGWLVDQIEEMAVVEADAARDDLRRRLDAVLTPRNAGVLAYSPNEEEVREAEARTGAKLPSDYRWFTETFGGTEWPYAIKDALDLAELRETMERELGSAPILPIATDRHGRYFGFMPRNEKVMVFSAAGVAPTGLRFIPWLELEIERGLERERIAQASARTERKVIVRRRSGRQGRIQE